MFLPFVLALPIFPVRLQTSIFGRSELNFRVRNGNGWTLALINTVGSNFRFAKNIEDLSILWADTISGEADEQSYDSI